MRSNKSSPFFLVWRHRQLPQKKNSKNESFFQETKKKIKGENEIEQIVALFPCLATQAASQKQKIRKMMPFALGFPGLGCPRYRCRTSFLLCVCVCVCVYIYKPPQKKPKKNKPQTGSAEGDPNPLAVAGFLLASACTQTQTHTNTHTHTHTHTHTNKYTHTNTNTHTHTHKHTHTHTPHTSNTHRAAISAKNFFFVYVYTNYT